MTCYIVCDMLNRTIFKRTDPVKVSLSPNAIISVSKTAAGMMGTSALLRRGD